MNRLFLASIILFSGLFSSVSAQEIGAYAFTRTPKLMNYNFGSKQVSYSHGVSAGLGLYRKNSFIELATFVFEGNTYGYYTFFGSTLKNTDLGNAFSIKTNWFGEITSLPSQGEIIDPTWIYTTGMCLLPNVQIQKFNIGIALCSGLAYQSQSLNFNNRFILNLSYGLTRN
ncbi:MAG: hypothetical protein JXQ90_04645 [Cyclobacteriaceae bacterium]